MNAQEESAPAAKKSRGRPRSTGQTTVAVRMRAADLAAIDAWAAAQPDRPSRKEAIRCVVALALARSA